jgi:hypothetical protein
MTGEPLDDLEQRRAELYAQLAGTGDFRPGSVNETWRRCGKPNCACAQPDNPGHGPRYLWTRSADGRTRTRQVTAADLDKVRREVAAYKQFVAVSEQIVQVNEAICLARPASPAGPPVQAGRDRDEQLGPLITALREEMSAEIARLAAEAARSLGCGAGMEAAEAVIRAGMLKLGGGMLGKLLAADPGYRGPRIDCDAGHQAEFISCRDKTFDTVLARSPSPAPGTTARRASTAWRRRMPGSASPAHRCRRGLTVMNDRAAAAMPFAKAAGLLEDLAGVHLTARRVERAAEASGAVKAAADRGRAALISGRKLVRCRRHRCRTSCTPCSTAPASR